MIKDNLDPRWRELRVGASQLPMRRSREIIIRYTFAPMQLFHLHLCTCNLFSYERLEIHDDDGEGKADPLVRGVYRLDQLVNVRPFLSSYSPGEGIRW